MLNRNPNILTKIECVFLPMWLDFEKTPRNLRMGRWGNYPLRSVQGVYRENINWILRRRVLSAR